MFYRKKQKEEKRMPVKNYKLPESLQAHTLQIEHKEDGTYTIAVCGPAEYVVMRPHYNPEHVVLCKDAQGQHLVHKYGLKEMDELAVN
jgi:hypothetical protein